MQRYRSCGSWACPGGLVSAGHGAGVAFGVPCGLDLKSQSLVIESFSVGSRAVLSTMGKVLAAAGSKSFMVLVYRVTKETTCVEKSIAGSGTLTGQNGSHATARSV